MARNKKPSRGSVNIPFCAADIRANQANRLHLRRNQRSILQKDKLWSFDVTFVGSARRRLRVFTVPVWNFTQWWRRRFTGETFGSNCVASGTAQRQLLTRLIIPVRAFPQYHSKANAARTENLATRTLRTTNPQCGYARNIPIPGRTQTGCLP